MASKDDKIKTQKMIVVACAVFAVLMIVALIVNVVILVSSNKYKNSLQAKINALNEEIPKNASEINYRETDDYIERYAREHLDMQGKDDITFIAK